IHRASGAAACPGARGLAKDARPLTIRRSQQRGLTEPTTVLTTHVLLAQLAGGNSLSPFILIAGMFAIMYFLMIRPQQKQLKEHRALLANLKNGDTGATHAHDSG